MSNHRQSAPYNISDTQTSRVDINVVESYASLRFVTIEKLILILVVLYFLNGCGGKKTETTSTTLPAPTEYKISTGASAGGSIIPQNLTISAGGNATFKLQPDSGYILHNINGCSGTLSELQYNVYNIAASCHIQVEYRIIQAPPINIASVVETGSAKITWKPVEGVKSYKVYIANRPFTSLIDIPNKTIIESTTTPSITYSLSKSYNNYYIRVSSVYDSIELLSSEQLNIVSNYKPIGSINDTGVTYCLLSNLNVDECKSDYAQRQDGNLGRDAKTKSGQLTKLGIGSAGFDFSKVGINGQVLPIQNKPWSNTGNESDGNNWSCARDNVTGLIWEVKRNTGITSTEKTYSWFSNSPSLNGGWPGSTGDNSCGLSQCNTEAYISHLNEIQYCGSNRWRLPTRAELLNIIMNTGPAPRLDPNVFPDVQSDTSYWTASTYFPTGQYAWAISMNSGIVFWQPKTTQLSVRLVHSE